MSTTISVNVSPHPYNVRIGAGLLKECGQELLAALPEDPLPSSIAVISDSQVAPLHLAATLEALAPTSAKLSSYVFPAGELSKNLTTVAGILEFLAKNHLTRSDLVVALGGGVVGDITGFAAAIYLRGIKVVQIPTTLLAAIDSSVGGKTGVDLPEGKNLAGAFWQPSLVLCDPAVLSTLPAAILHDGAAEAIKYGAIADRHLFQTLADGQLEPRMEAIIARCVAIKADLVSRDEFDFGDRALLNFGHTIGHAIEKCSNFRLSHGQAVGIGMVMMSQIAACKQWSQEDCTPAITAALQRYDLPTATEFTAPQLIPYMMSDKKRKGDLLTIVVPRTLGRCVRRTISIAEVKNLF